MGAFQLPGCMPPGEFGHEVVRATAWVPVGFLGRLKFRVLGFWVLGFRGLSLGFWGFGVLGFRGLGFGGLGV